MNIAACHIQLHRFHRLHHSNDTQVSDHAYLSTIASGVARPARYRLFASIHSARVRASDVTFDLLPGGCLLLSADQAFSWESVEEQSERLEIDFSLYSCADGVLSPLPDLPFLLGLPCHLPRQQFQQIVEWSQSSEGYSAFSPAFAQDEAGGFPAAAADAWMHTAQLQLLLSMILRIQQPSSEQEQESSIRSVIRYMETHYDQPLTVEQLATRAGMIRWQFSERFKSLTGSKPSDYLNKLRIDQAKQLLDSDASMPLREVARLTGFSDEYYFSRRFRQATGHAPRQFAEILARGRSRIIHDGLGRKVRLPEGPERIVSSGSKTLGELLTLQMRPIAAGLSVIKEQVIFQRRLQGIVDFGIQISPEIAARLKPQLFVLSFCNPELLETLSSFGAVVVVEGNHNSTYHRLRLIGQVLDRQHAVETWIDDYEQTIRDTRRKLADRYTPGEQASVFLHLPTGFYVMGQNGMAATLYEMLGFIPPPAIREMMTQQCCWRSITADQISHYASDRNFLLTSRHSLTLPDVQNVWSRLHDPANPCHLLDACWNFDDPITRHRLAQQLPQLFNQSLGIPSLL